MGLLSHIEKETSFGNDIQNVSFSAFCKKNNFPLCALFQKVKDNFLITKSVGLDAKSILSSVSSLDFWNGTIGNDTDVHSYKDETLSAFYQLFSEKIKDAIHSIHFARLNDSSIFAKIDTDQNYSPLQIDFSKINFSSTTPPSFQAQSKKNYSLFLLSSNVALQKIMSEVSFPKEIYTSLCNSIQDAFFEEISQMLCEPNFCKKNGNGEIKIVFESDGEIETELLQHHISSFAKNVFESFSDSLILVKAAFTSSSDEVTSFLTEN